MSASRRGRPHAPDASAPADTGSAVAEFAVLGTVLFGVLVQLVVCFGALQRATLATSSAAREVGRAVVRADSRPAADEAASRVVAEVERDHGLGPGSLAPRVEGTPQRGARLRVTVHTEVPIARIPFLGTVWPSLAVPVDATHVVQVDRYRSFDG